MLYPVLPRGLQHPMPRLACGTRIAGQVRELSANEVHQSIQTSRRFSLGFSIILDPIGAMPTLCFRLRWDDPHCDGCRPTHLSDSETMPSSVDIRTVSALRSTCLGLISHDFHALKRTSPDVSHTRPNLKALATASESRQVGTGIIAATWV